MAGGRKNPMLAIPVDRGILYACGEGKRTGRDCLPTSFLAGALGQYGIKSDARTGLRVKGGSTSDAAWGITTVMAR